MATGYAKATGKLGVCLATSGPGGLHLLNGLYDAKLDHQPVLAITGVQATSQLGTDFQQEVHLDRVFMDVCVYNALAHVPISIPTLVDMAVRASLSRRGVSHLTFPVDMQEAPAELQPYEGGLGTARMPKTAPTYQAPRIVPREEDLRRAAEILNGATRVVMLVGVGATEATEEVLRVAEILGSPIVKTLPGKAVVADDHPLTTGGLGLLGTRPSEEAIEEADAILLVGTNYPYTSYLPPDKRNVQIELDPTRIGNRLPVEVPLVGEAADTLRALVPLLQEKADRGFLRRAQEDKRTWDAEMAALEDPEREPIQPQYLMRVIDRLATDDAILSTDSGTIATWAARHFDIRGDRQFYLCSNLASMACGLPYAIAAQVAYPGRQVIAFVGDGGFAMLMAEFLTACRYGLPIKVVVNNNALLGQILWEQMALGFPEYGVRWEEHADFAPWAESCGGLGLRVDKPGDVEAAIREALAASRPALVDVRVNADEPPMPPTVEYDKAKGFVQSFLRGQPRRVAIASTLFRDRLTTFGASEEG